MGINKNYTVWKLFGGFMLVLLALLLSTQCEAQVIQGEGLEIVQFNAGFNEANSVDWLVNVTDCEVKQSVDIQKNAKAQGAYKIVVVPTIILFNDGEEVKRFQANIMMIMEATLKEVQQVIDETLMESF